MTELSSRIGLCLLAALSLSACSGSPPPPSQSSAHAGGGPAATSASPGLPGAQGETGLGEDFTLPLNSFMTTASQTLELERAREVVMARCVVARGFRYDVSKDPVISQDPNRAMIMDFGENGNRRRYGLTSLTAAQFGAQLPSDTLAPSPHVEDQHTNLRGFGRPTPQLIQAIHECIDTAGQKFSNPGQVGGLTSSLKAESFAKSVNDPRVRQKFAQWSACMRGKGYTVADPTVLDLPSSESAQVRDSARREAVADVTCKLQFSVVDTWYQAERQIQEQQVAAHQEELNAVKRQIDQALATAAQILQSAPH